MTNTQYPTTIALIGYWLLLAANSPRFTAGMKGLLIVWRSHHAQHQTSPGAAPGGRPGLLDIGHLYYLHA